MTPVAVPYSAVPLALLLLACDPAPDRAAPEAVRGEAPAFTAQPPVLRRLTYAQYQSTVAALFGEGLVIPAELEPDTRVSGLYAVGASVTSISSLGVERYEAAAFDIAEQVLADESRRSALVPCTPASTIDSDCARAVLADLGPRAWRRPLESDELDRLVGIADTAAATLDDFDQGLAYALAALLQSPHFLFRPEPGEDDPERPGERRYTAYEMASRLSYFLWNTMPDAELFAAAADGSLLTTEGLAAQVDRLLADERAREGMAAFITDTWMLSDLDDLTKDPAIYTYMSDGLGASARQQTLLDAEAIVFDDDGDFRSILTTRATHLDRTLAALYDVPAPAREGFGATTLPESGGRRGLLGQVSFLALQSHATSTSVTRRGIFVREVLLCQALPSPPAGLNTSIPETTEETPTMRDRVAQHLEDPSCAACHNYMDPIGLGFENFDGIGRWRTTENEVEIDASGDLDGVDFDDAWALSAAIADHSAFAPCVNKTLYAYAQGRVGGEGEDDIVDWHAEGFAVEDYRLKFLLRDIATGQAFRTAGVAE